MPTKPLLAISLLFWSAVLAAVPFQDVPVNDDWAYAESVRGILKDGAFHASDWATPTLVVQAYWGALVSRLAPTDAPLRLSTLLLAWLGALAFFLLLRRGRISPGNEAPLALLLAFNPLFFALSASFMTDVPALALTLAALCLADRNLPAGSASLALAYGVRQSALASVAGLSAFLRKDLRTQAALWTLPLLAAAVHLLTMARTPGQFQFLILEKSLAPFFLLTRIGGCLVYCGLFLSPLALSVLADGPSRFAGISRRRLFWTALLSASMGLFLLLGGALPYPAPSRPDGSGIAFFDLASYLGPSGLGCLNMDATDLRALPLLGSPSFWKLLSALSWLSWTTLIAACPLPSRDARKIAWSLGLPCAALLGAASFFDRYTLPLVPAALVLAAGALGPSRRSRMALWAGIAITAFFSVAGTADSLRAAGTAWRLGEASGLPPERVRAGLDWCRAHEWPRRAAEFKARSPRARVLGLEIPLSCMDSPIASVSFQGEGEIIGRASFFSPLAMREETLFLRKLP